MNQSEGKKKRKTRSDKKIAMAPYISDQHRIWIHRIARHAEIPEGEVGIRLIEAALFDEECIRFFSSYFKRTYWFSEHLCFRGNPSALDIEDYIQVGQERGRFKVRASQAVYHQLDEFKIALGTPYISHAAHALLKYALHELRLIHLIDPRIDFVAIRDMIRPYAKSSKSSSAWSIWQGRGI